MTRLRLADDLHLPSEIAGQTVALVGIRGSGKTNTAGVMAEELLDRHQPIVVLDPMEQVGLCLFSLRELLIVLGRLG